MIAVFCTSTMRSRVQSPNVSKDVTRSSTFSVTAVVCFSQFLSVLSMSPLTRLHLQNSAASLSSHPTRTATPLADNESARTGSGGDNFWDRRAATTSPPPTPGARRPRSESLDVELTGSQEEVKRRGEYAVTLCEENGLTPGSLDTTASFTNTRGRIPAGCSKDALTHSGNTIDQERKAVALAFIKSDEFKVNRTN